MRFLATPNFTKALSFLGKEYIKDISIIINYIQSSDKNKLMYKAAVSQDDIYIMKNGHLEYFIPLEMIRLANTYCY